MTTRAGLVLAGRYELTERIAVGGMGEVWRAHDRTLDRTVAVKVLREDLRGNETALARLRAEARNGAGLSHPNVATLIDYGERAGSGFLVMEFVAGEPLSDVLGREGTLPVRDTLRIIAQCAAGLHAAHVAGVVHRDVKPSNILLTPDGTAKLTDFGISLGVGQAALTAAGMVMGTAQYLPPELALGKKASPAGDIYALGIVGYEALAGRRPFTGANPVEIAFAHVEQPVPPLPDALPAPVRQLVTAMLAKDPADRPRSAAALARTAEELLETTVTTEPGPRRAATPAGGATPGAADVPLGAAGDDSPAPASRPTALPTKDDDAVPDDPDTPLDGSMAGPPSWLDGPSATHDAAPVPVRETRDVVPLVTASSRPLTTGGTATTPRAAVTRRDLHRPASRAIWRRPTWRELAADRRWLTALGVGVVLVIVLVAVLIGTLGLSEARPAGTGRHQTTDQPSN